MYLSYIRKVSGKYTRNANFIITHPLKPFLQRHLYEINRQNKTSIKNMQNNNRQLVE